MVGMTLTRRSPKTSDINYGFNHVLLFKISSTRSTSVLANCSNAVDLLTLSKLFTINSMLASRSRSAECWSDLNNMAAAFSVSKLFKITYSHINFSLSIPNRSADSNNSITFVSVIWHSSVYK